MLLVLLLVLSLLLLLVLALLLLLLSGVVNAWASLQKNEKVRTSKIRHGEERGFQLSCVCVWVGVFCTRIF